LIAAELGDVHEQQVWRVLRAHKLDLAASKSWCESSDPQFIAKAAEVVGLYMAPPENAVVICVDEKPSIQALERAQGYLKLPNGRTMSGHSHPSIFPREPHDAPLRIDMLVDGQLVGILLPRFFGLGSRTLGRGLRSPDGHGAHQGGGKLPAARTEDPDHRHVAHPSRLWGHNIVLRRLG